ncbi:MAG: hypothetical protein H7210_09515 [Pyrinomonadaceae bacterium]|nr:hypothetical protein [Phycisphaerales bacterium]
MMRHKHFGKTIAAVLTCAVGLVGCTSNGPTDLAVAPGEYAATFDAARLVLRDAKFDLERVDASGGVITTREKATAGLATPWDSEQQTAGQEFEDLVQHQQRRVRITFETADDAATADAAGSSAASGATPQAHGGASSVNLIDDPRPTNMRVRVVIERINRPNWRVDSSSIRLTSYAWDPALAEREMQPRYEVAVAEDSDFAQRLVELIRARAGK